MPKIEVTRTEPDRPLGKGLIVDFDHLMQSVRRRAYELFEKRGGEHGADLEDWIKAEEELLFPAKIETSQEPGRHTLRLSVPGFSANDLKVYTVGNSIVFKGVKSEKSEANGVSEERSKDIFYQCALPAGARSNEITADYKNEGLTINIPVEGQPKPVESQTPESKTKDLSAAAAA